MDRSGMPMVTLVLGMLLTAIGLSWVGWTLLFLNGQIPGGPPLAEARRRDIENRAALDLFRRDLEARKAGRPGVIGERTMSEDEAWAEIREEGEAFWARSGNSGGYLRYLAARDLVLSPLVIGAGLSIYAVGWAVGRRRRTAIRRQ